VFVDWPSDAMDFASLLMTGPGQAVDMGHQTIITILRHVDIYPTTLAGAVQHNALWDAMAIRQFVMEMIDFKSGRRFGIADGQPIVATMGLLVREDPALGQGEERQLLPRTSGWIDSQFVISDVDAHCVAAMVEWQDRR
jgi:hypothetical protein